MRPAGGGTRSCVRAARRACPAAVADPRVLGAQWFLGEGDPTGALPALWTALVRVTQVAAASPSRAAGLSVAFSDVLGAGSRVARVGPHSALPSALAVSPGRVGVGQDAVELTTLGRAGSHTRGAWLVPPLLALSLSCCPR